MIVSGLEQACDVVDMTMMLVPKPARDMWYRLVGPLGCPRGLANWSARLDERWGTNVWKGTDL